MEQFLTSDNGVIAVLAALVVVQARVIWVLWQDNKSLNARLLDVSVNAARDLMDGLRLLGEATAMFKAREN